MYEYDTHVGLNFKGPPMSKLLHNIEYQALYIIEYQAKYLIECDYSPHELFEINRKLYILAKTKQKKKK